MNHTASFIPARRALASRCKQRKIKWTLANIAAVGIGALGALSARSIFLGGEHITASSTAAAQSRLDSIITEQTTQAQQLQLINTRLQSHADATQHPDWSVLIGYISRIGAQSIALDAFVLTPGETRGSYNVTLSGQAVSQNAVTEFVLDLERSGVFHETSLMRSSRGNEQMYLFDIECRIGQPPATDPEKKGTN